MSDTRPRNPSQSPSLLEQVVPKLRPFQREALEFATEGKLYDRQRQRQRQQQHAVSSMAASTVGSTNGQPMTARISGAKENSTKLLLADEMGLGKTVTSLAIMAYYEPEWPLLILCPASLRYTWPAEIEKFFPSIAPQTIYVASGFNDIGFTTQKPTPLIVVVTYSLLQSRSAVARCLEYQNFNCIIADESHNLKQKSSQRSKMILPILSRARRVVLLSGTPALARPVELWTQLSCLAPKVFGNWTTFTNKYCNPKRKFIGGRVTMDFSGSSNEAELHQNLKSVMLRRLKSDVLSELPAKQRSIIPVAISREEKEKCKQAMAEMGDKRDSIQDLFGDDARQADFEAKSKMMAAYQQSGIGKAQAVADYVVDWLAGSETQKILVFAHHRAVLDAVDQRLLAKYPNSHIRIDGQVPTGARAQLVRKFQTCARVRVALLSMTAAGVGLTLTAASTVLFSELHWTPGVLAQAEDRAHRIGQTHDSVQINYLVCKDESLSLDMTMWKMLGKKIGTLGQVIDGNEDTPYIYTAKESLDEKPPPNSGTRGKSGQDELSSFFAESSNEGTIKRRKTPVKGSIQSFFGKATAAKQTPTMSVSEDPEPRVASLEQAPSESQDTVDSEVSWACDVCTFFNSKPQRRGEWLPCEICGNLHKAADTNTVEPRAGPSSKIKAAPTSAPISKASSAPTLEVTKDKVTWTCQNCTFANTSKRLATGWYPCKMCNEQRVANDDDSDSDLEDYPSTPTPVFDRRRARPSMVSTLRRDGSSKRPVRVSNAFDDLIVIDCDSPSAGTISVKKCRLSKTSVSDDIILIDDDDKISLVTPVAAQRVHDELTFSVSKNSERITIHFAGTGASSLVNFAIDQVVTSDTADRLLDSKVANRISTEPLSIAVAFDESGIRSVLDRVTDSDDLLRDKVEAFGRELKAFVSEYLALREVEKKALKYSGQAFPARGLAQTAAKLMSSSIGGTERYAGGAKERAQENRENGTETSIDTAVLDGSRCAWCAGALQVASISAESVYCSQDCAEEGRLRRGGMYASVRIRSAVFALEGGKCSLCKINAHALFEQIRALQPAERLNKLLAVNWKLPKSSKAMENILNHPKEGDFWQADHIHAVSEGGGACGLDNLRTLCTPCHLVETEKLRGRLKLKSPSKQDGETSKRKQVDIRSIFVTKEDNADKRPRN